MRYFAFISLLVMVGCNTAAPPPRQEVSLAFKGTVTETPSGGYTPAPILLFELRNDTAEPIWFDGFHLTAPLYEIHRIDGDAREEVGSSMSATGASHVPLAAGQATAFALRRSFDEAGWFELEITIGTLEQPDRHQILSDPFQLPPRER